MEKLSLIASGCGTNGPTGDELVATPILKIPSYAFAGKNK